MILVQELVQVLFGSHVMLKLSDWQLLRAQRRRLVARALFLAVDRFLERFGGYVVALDQVLAVEDGSSLVGHKVRLLLVVEE